MLLMIDNYDSFTYNVVHYLKELNADVTVVKNDELSLEAIKAIKPSKIVISPGPGVPAFAGVSVPAIKAFAGKTPILGVCLGHQGIGEAFGAKVVRAGEVMHGKTSLIQHNNKGVFSGIEVPFVATRYHSLVLDKESFPDELEITAWTETEDGEFGEIMGIRHRSLLVEGVQFHPESILSEHGHQLLKNFLSY